MNILPKKRWHVRTKQNIERVRRDEAQAAQEEKELKRRIRLAEQEARTDLLRKRAKGGYSESGGTKDNDDHVNFFRELEESGGYVGGTNKDHEAEEKARKEKFEKDIGLLTYLGQSSAEAKGEQPWYLKCTTKDLILGSEGKDETANAKHKVKLDPLNDMKKYLALKEKACGKMLGFSSNKEKHKKDSKLKEMESSKKMSKIEELRAKRLKREAEEKKRAQQYLENLRKTQSGSEEIIFDDRLRQYNSQFNPHLARNNQAITK